MSERFKFMGQREELRQEEMKFRLQIQGLVEAMRDNLDPTIPEETLQTEVLGQQMKDLFEAQVDLRRVLKRLRQIKDILGD